MALVLVKYGVDNPAERVKFEIANENDKIVLIQNGVFFAVVEDVTKLTKAEVYALKNDLEARGFCTADVKNVKLVDYDGLVELIEKEEKFIG
ncbi:MAG: sulfurtransferase complex subunit TusB [Fervidobacterium sp.]|uniref:sulfurtransferase complex subunit TusB n=1 Tax=Fervidobacterium sp. TaxID=1871331 RepID=UPI00404B12AF